MSWTSRRVLADVFWVASMFFARGKPPVCCPGLSLATSILNESLYSTTRVPRAGRNQVIVRAVHVSSVQRSQRASPLPSQPSLVMLIQRPVLLATAVVDHGVLVLLLWSGHVLGQDSKFLCVCVCVCVRARARACVRACVRACIYIGSCTSIHIV